MMLPMHGTIATASRRVAKSKPVTQSRVASKQAVCGPFKASRVLKQRASHSHKTPASMLSCMFFAECLDVVPWRCSIAIAWRHGSAIDFEPARSAPTIVPEVERSREKATGNCARSRRLERVPSRRAQRPKGPTRFALVLRRSGGPFGEPRSVVHPVNSLLPLEHWRRGK